MNNLIELGVFMFDDDITEELREQISVTFISAIVKVSTIGANEDLRNTLLRQCLKYAGVPATKRNITVLEKVQSDEALYKSRRAQEFSNIFLSRYEKEMNYSRNVYGGVRSAINMMRQ